MWKPRPKHHVQNKKCFVQFLQTSLAGDWLSAQGHAVVLELRGSKQFQTFFSVKSIYLSLASSDIRKCVLNEIHVFCLIGIRWCYFCLLLRVVLLILLVKGSLVPWLFDPLEMRRNWEAGPEGLWGGPVSTSGAKTKNYGSIPKTSKIDEFASFRSRYSKSSGPK